MPVEKNVSHADATTNDATFSITPLCQMLTAARCPSQSLTNVERSSGERRAMPAGVPGARLKWISRLATVTPHPARSHGRAARSSTRRLRKSESTARKTVRAVHEPSAGWMHGAIPSNRAPARYQPAPSIATASTPVDKPTTPYVCSVPSRNSGYTVPYSAERVKKINAAAPTASRMSRLERVDEQRQCLKREHPLDPADNQGKRELAYARPKPERKQLVQHGP